MLVLSRHVFFASLSLFTASSLGCGGGDSKQACSVKDQTGCDDAEVCEEVEGKEAACFAPIKVEGKVFSALDQKPIEGARVVARDANDAVVSNVALTKADGTYSLTVPAKRDAKGAPLKVQYTLRSDAAGFQTFPTAPRVALPIDTSTASGDPKVVKSAATDISLIALEKTSGLGSIAGKVIADNPGGTLIVAGRSTGVADFSGNYEVFNVPTGGSVEVRGYAQGLALKPATADVKEGEQTKGIDLQSSGKATTAVTGKVDIVNGGGASSTSVVLAVEETFIDTVNRGEVPRGLRAGSVTGEFTIKDVPDGKYVVLAAFENDGLVRDPDTSIGGTQIVHIAVPGDSAIATSFKVTGALSVVSPGADKIEEVSGTPSFVWADDSSEKGYEVRLFDAFGTKVWENLMVPSVSGSADVTAPYDGPALKPGMIYQFRATSLSGGGVPISTTEDLKGVFVYK